MTLMILELFGQLADSLSAHHLIPASLLDRPVIHLLACDKKMARNLAAEVQVVDDFSLLTQYWVIDGWINYLVFAYWPPSETDSSQYCSTSLFSQEGHYDSRRAFLWELTDI